MGKNTATVLSKSNDNNPKKKRKKGRPSLLDIQKRALRLIKQQEQQNPNSENQTKTTNISCLHFHPILSNDHGLDFASIPSNSDPTSPSSTKKIRKLVDVHGSSGETVFFFVIRVRNCYSLTHLAVGFYHNIQKWIDLIISSINPSSSFCLIRYNSVI